jgi:hypothetical protein
MKRKERERIKERDQREGIKEKGEEEEGTREERSGKLSTLPAILPPRKIIIRHLHVIIWLLPIVISEVHIVRESASAVVASHAIHEADAILRVAYDAFLGVAAHHECLIEVR